MSASTPPPGRPPEGDSRVARFIVRRLGQAVLTILGVMVFTFFLFRVVAGDIAGSFMGQKATRQAKADWRHEHGYDLPLVLNVHDRLVLADRTEGERSLRVEDLEGGEVADQLALVFAEQAAGGQEGTADIHTRVGHYVFGLSRDSSVGELLVERGDGTAQVIRAPAKVRFTLADGTVFRADLAGVRTAGELIDRINQAPGNEGRLEAGIREWEFSGILDSQLADHLWKSVTFSARSLDDNSRLTGIIAERAPRSLALMIPATAIGWLLAMVIACFVAYYRDTVIDRAGVFLSVLGMCIPYLAFLIYGQWLMFEIAPEHAFGLRYRANIYVPVTIMVIAGLGASVRFYRTVILDEINRDYVRTARATGLPLTTVLFKHVLKNCMLPILTNLITMIPFLIMGSLLVEYQFGIPGLGDLMITSIQKRNEPVMNGLVFLTTLLYTLSLLITDISYAVFDPRIRLR
jgi:peptide/nickel transport system permease protein